LIGGMIITIRKFAVINDKGDIVAFRDQNLFETLTGKRKGKK